MRQWLRYNQIAHYLMNRSDFEIKIVQKIECLICISKGSLLLKHPVYSIIDGADKNENVCSMEIVIRNMFFLT